MNEQPIPTAGIRTAFDRAAQVHSQMHSRVQGQARTQAQVQNPYQPQGTERQGAARQIAGRQVASSGQPATVEQAIASAAQQTSVDFDYLVAQAQVESSMNPTARARTSSATGLYQFIESTWLNTMQRHGERFGLGDVSAQIGVSQSGSAYVADPSARAAILDLRNDPQIASLMAAGLAEDNRAHLAPILGRQPEHNELYLAHFLGAGGAGRFLSAMQDNPNQRADALFRRPAAANRPVFYERDGSPRTLAGVMDFLSGKLERARANAPMSMPQGYSAASLAPPLALPPSVTPPPYMIADEAVFGPNNPPVLTGRNRPIISGSGPLSTAPSQAPLQAAPQSAPQRAPQRAPMSSLLQSTFGDVAPGDDSRPAQQVRRAYDQLKALGL